MVKVFILIIATFIVNWIVKKILLLCVSYCKTPKWSVRFRDLYMIIRRFIIGVYTLSLLYFIYPVILNLFDNFHNALFTFSLLVSIIALASLPYAAMSLPISSMTISDIPKKDFALFLRGFSNDSYEPSMIEKIDRFYNKFNPNRLLLNRKKKQKEIDVNEKPFCELDFYSAIQQFIPVYSIGMTKELDCPEGTKRIYLSDETWQKDVSHLIDIAKYVFILVNPSDSCIWEITQCRNKAIDKTVFFMDNDESLRELQEKMGENIPRCIKWVSGKHSFAYSLGEKCYHYGYRNDDYGFSNSFRVYLEDRELLSDASEEVHDKDPDNNIKEDDYSRFMPK